MRENDGPTKDTLPSPYALVKASPVNGVPGPSTEFVYWVKRPPARAVSESQGISLNGNETMGCASKRP
jgi:hypothetical protein